MPRFSPLHRTGPARCKARIVVVLLGLVIALGMNTGPADAAGPSQVVQRLNASLLTVMQEAHALGYRGRFARLAPDLVQIFDFPAMTKAAVGRTWKSLDPERQRDMVEAFSAFSIANFAKRFDGYSGERFEIVGEESGNRGKIVVRNRIVKTNGEAVSIDYLTRKNAGQWRIVDILLDGRQSELASRRAEYAAIIKRHGFDHLLRSLQNKVTANGG